MVAAPQVEAAYEGRAVLEAGGNAADATVTAALVQGIVDPHRSGIGGFGCSTVYFRRARDGQGPVALSIDFHGRVGRRARPDQWEKIYVGPAEDGFGYLVEGKVNDVGYGSITTPGMLAGLGEIHRRFGRLPWRDLVERAIPYAENGFFVPREIAEFWRRPGLCGRVSTHDRLGFTEAGRAICFKKDASGALIRDSEGRLEPFATGERFVQRELAATYARIAEEGWESFYRGALAREIAQDFAAQGAWVTAEDLAEFRPSVGPPLAGSYRGHRILTTPLPGGGVALLQALRLLEEHDLASLGHLSVDAIDLIADVLRVVSADRLERQGDPAFGALPDERFLEADLLAELRRRIKADAPIDPEGPDTTHLSVIDGEGNLVAFSHSLGYNSGVFAPGLGVLFNNCMSGFHPLPGHIGSIAPGKARSTAIAETIVFRRDGTPWMTIGSPGGARITGALVQALLGCIDFDMTLAESVVQPRFDGYEPRLLALDQRFPEPILRELESRGWTLKPSDKPYGAIGRIYGIEIEESPRRRLIAGIDPGSPGAAFRSRPGSSRAPSDAILPHGPERASSE